VDNANQNLSEPYAELKEGAKERIKNCELSYLTSMGHFI